MKLELKLIVLAIFIAGAVVIVKSINDGTYGTETHHGQVSDAVPSPHEFPLYPNPSLTPGKVDPEATKEKVCTAGYTATVRHVPKSVKTRVFLEYGLPYSPRDYEVDHFVSLELGGSNDIENLWPERYCPLPHQPDCLGAREKDKVENYLHREVCNGDMPLQDAQQQIIADWVSIYNRIRKP